ncbi:hypothetical protein [Pseudomonas sp. 30_B]|uniref:DUF6966 domain-containing protein n=1 Tax=Pseudomonas sp. 30_B TaxID=2813575 RepID=UPI001A9CBE0A|nr:hypothetical protein [Pseudomonas sp. 30_B]
MGPKTTELLNILDELVALLHAAGEMHWAHWLERDACRLRERDFYGVEHFLNAFGGMGSINDLIIHPENGHRISADEIRNVNERLDTLLNRGATLGKEIVRCHEAG